MWRVTKKLALAALTCLMGLGFTIAPAPSNAAPYVASATTHCDPGGVSAVRRGNTFVTHVHIRSNGNTKPKGTVKLTYQRVAGGYHSTKSVNYPGSPIDVAGPAFTQLGRYKVSVEFTPTNTSRFRSCSGSYTLELKAAVSPADDDGDPVTPPDGGDGILPQTGGPNVIWLVLALGLLVGGGGLVASARRRRGTST